MAWAKNYLWSRPNRPKIKADAKLPPAPHAKRIRPRVGWMAIGRTRKQWRDAQKKEA